LKQGADSYGAPGGNSCALGSQISTSFRQKAAQEAERLHYELPSGGTQRHQTAHKKVLSQDGGTLTNGENGTQCSTSHPPATPAPLHQEPFVICEVGTVTIYRKARSEIHFFHQYGRRLIQNSYLYFVLYTESCIILCRRFGVTYCLSHQGF